MHGAHSLRIDHLKSRELHQDSKGERTNLTGGGRWLTISLPVQLDDAQKSVFERVGYPNLDTEYIFTEVHLQARNLGESGGVAIVSVSLLTSRFPAGLLTSLPVSLRQ